MYKSVKAVLLDLNGTLHVGDQPTRGAVAALERLRQSNMHVRFVTNTTKESRQSLQERLHRIGFGITSDEIYTVLRAAHTLLERRDLRPYYIMEDETLREEFSDLAACTCVDGSDATAVVLALAPSKLNYDVMNNAFRILERGNPLIALHKARLYRRSDGLALGPGSFVEALQFASGVQAEVVGKPEKAFFQACLEGLDCAPEDVVMIGDDARDDVCGAVNAGLQGILVKTGKYQPGDEASLQSTAAVACDSFAAAVDMLLSSSSQQPH